MLTRNVNRQYDDSFAVEGAKIGSTLRIRLPDRALVTDGAALQVQDDNEQFTTLTVSSQKHIGVNFTSAELTMQSRLSLHLHMEGCALRATWPYSLSG